MFAFIAATTALTMAAPASDISAVSWGKERMKNSSTGPDNTLPSFLFMAGGMCVILGHLLYPLTHTHTHTHTPNKQE